MCITSQCLSSDNQAIIWFNYTNLFVGNEWPSSCILTFKGLNHPRAKATVLHTCNPELGRLGQEGQELERPAWALSPNKTDYHAIPVNLCTKNKGTNNDIIQRPNLYSYSKGSLIFCYF